ncbi:MAG: preprotein translocase subunit SecG [Melioribacteraceae bacterium]|nr:preprotein translocase subunit SecG [Melioribacteraceae bacterium]MCF8263875.1 preprotein translocase subunit SecG [Melioribacteraceae bacterium]MCF8412399.1 preprotein translocase subunit SecG [Melioribacteraceae bacterium]
MYTLLVTISIIIAFFLVIVVLLQSSKGGGLAGTFGGGGQMGNVFGSRRTADFLSRATWWLGGSMLFLAIVVNMFFLPGKTTVEERQSIIQSTQQRVPTTPSLPQLPTSDNAGSTSDEATTDDSNQE